MKTKYFIPFILIIIFVGCNKSVKVLQVPGKDQFCKINIGGVSVLPSGRYATPVGKSLRITNDPYGMAISPNGKKAVTLHNEVFTIIDLTSLETLRIPSYDKKIKSPLSSGSFLGVAFSTDSKKIYLSGGNNGTVIVYDIEKLKKLKTFDLNGKIDGVDYQDSFTSDLLLNDVNNELLVLDRGNFRMVRIDLSNGKVSASTKVGRQPFGIALSPDKKQAFVANVGLYSYPLIEGATPENFDSLRISHHPYGENTKESIEGTIVEGRKIPGLGSPLHPDAMSVFTIDLNDNKVISKFKTGHQIGQTVEDAEVVGGASPNSIAVGKQFAYVTNATNDNISIIDHTTQKIVGHIPIQIDKRIDNLRGSLPFGITMSKDEKTLYVALLGFNAVAVIDIPTRTTKGLIPTGWGATRVELSEDEKYIYIISIRGLGSGPNGGDGFVSPIQGHYVGDIQLGSFQKVTMPTDDKLAEYTKQVIDNTFIETSIVDNGK
ncbi:MAG: YncE family protein, partial [Saprospiraceae bacterium]